MKKVALVTCYFQENYGSMLQAYATQMVLDQWKIDNETIDVSGFCREMRKAQWRYGIRESLTVHHLAYKFQIKKCQIQDKKDYQEYEKFLQVRRDKFQEFERSRFRLSKAYYSKDELGAGCSKEYETVLLGGDKLWSPENIAEDYYTLSCIPDTVNKVAYATDFGNTELPRRSAEKAKKFLRHINYISVGEKSGVKLVRKIDVRKASLVCDPTLLLTGEQWLEVQQEKPLLDAPYIFCYFQGKNPKHRDFAQRLKFLTGMPIIALVHLDTYMQCDKWYADQTPYEVGPGEFLNYIRNAQYICTDSFYGGVFASLYKKEFFAFHPESKHAKQAINSRIDHLLEQLGIKGRLLVGDEEVKDCIQVKTDYDKVNQRLEAVRTQSQGYLRKALQIRPGKNSKVSNK